MTGMPDLKRLEQQLIDIAEATRVIVAVVEEVQLLSEGLDKVDCRHDVTVHGNGLDATIDVHIDLTSRAPRIRDVLGPVPTVSVVPITSQQDVLDAFAAEAIRAAAVQVIDTAIDAALAEPGILVPTDDSIPADLSDDWDEADPVRAPDPNPAREAATPAEATAGGNEAHAAAEEVPASSATPAALAADVPRRAPWDNLWTAEEDALILTMSAAGSTIKQIAASLPHRTAKAVDVRRQKLRSRGVAAPAAANPVQQPVTAVPPLPPAPPAAAPSVDAVDPIPEQPSDAPPLGAMLVGAEQVRLGRLGRWGGWTLDLDLALVAGLTKGMKLAEVAIDIGMDAAACKRRFAELVPDRTHHQQVAVLKALTDRAASAKAAA